MARKSSTPKKKKPEEIELTREDVFEQFFDMIAEKGLGRFKLSILADKLGVPLPFLLAHYGSVQQIFDDFSDFVDSNMVYETSIDSDSTKRDRYFELFMARFDTLEMYRPGVVRWLNDLPKYPDLFCTTLRRWDKSVRLMLDMAGDSPLLPVKKIGLMGIYLNVLRSWTKDESGDLSTTMAALDRALEKAESFAATFLTRKKPV